MVALSNSKLGPQLFTDRKTVLYSVVTFLDILFNVCTCVR